MRRIPLAVIAVVLAGASACGSSSAGSGPGGLSPAAAVQAASTATTQAGSAKMTLGVTSKVGPQTVVITGEGAFQLDGSVGIFNVSLDPGSGKPLTLEERIVGGRLYLKAPPLGDSYYSLATTALVGTSLGQGTDPTVGFKLLLGAGEDVKVVGKEKVRDTQTTHYRGTYQLRKALDKVGGSFDQAFAAQLKTSGETPVPFDAYVDNDGRLRKLVQVVTMTSQGREITSTSTTELYDFGTAVDVTAPPADKVKDGTPLLKGLRG